LFVKTTKNSDAISIDRKINDYGYTSDNKYGKFKSDVESWEKYQIDGAKKIITTDQFDIKDIKYVGGLDISFDNHDDMIGSAYITVYDVLNKVVVYEDHKKIQLDIPYFSGFLGFREIPAYIEILDKLKKFKPEFYPQILMIDGFGILHYRGFGSASHIGFETGIPTIGVAKTLLYVDGLNEKIIKQQFRNECKKAGDYIKLIGKSTNKVYGVAYKSSVEVVNPIYITIGHNISLESCIEIVKLTTKYRIPEPIRISDINSKLFLK
jgi:deoxyribonuclease V